MNITEAISTAASLFVLPAYRERFVLEASKKPGKLMSRVCHHIDEVFERRFSGGSCQYVEGDACVLFTLTGERTVTTWRDAMRLVQLGGGGVFIVDGAGRKFFAQSEGFPPSRQFGGNA